MKPAPFTYHRPAGLDEALDVLDQVGSDGKVLAGGQSLLPLLSMRLAAPAHLVDVNHLPGLDVVEVTADVVRCGALVRHTDLLRHPAAFDAQPLLRRALQHVAHPTIRNRGTTVGSICHADPAAEMPAVTLLLGGTLVVRSRRGERRIAAADLFAGPLETTLATDELAVAVEWPVTAPRESTAIVEVSRRHGDYAVCGVAAQVRVDEDGTVRAARAVYVSMGLTPPVLDLTGAVAGQHVERADWAGAAALATEQLEPEADIHASADYRRHLAGVLTRRAFEEAG
ncbi:FAD binding domain-containing protein [Angustibacter luteus]|uniref:Xanthine dehydrogenase family protein subunit M n=1 Tax=Angustibacter luteus TaxID=658456 RepID=A0ABW1JAP5_9ACTN